MLDMGMVMTTLFLQYSKLVSGRLFVSLQCGSREAVGRQGYADANFMCKEYEHGLRPSAAPDGLNNYLDSRPRFLPGELSNPV